MSGEDHAIAVRGIWRGDGLADVRLECSGCEWFADLTYPTALFHLVAMADGHRKMAEVDEAAARSGAAGTPREDR